jgi:hypothetical protein
MSCPDLFFQSADVEASQVQDEPVPPRFGAGEPYSPAPARVSEQEIRMMGAAFSRRAKMKVIPNCRITIIKPVLR